MARAAGRCEPASAWVSLKNMHIGTVAAKFGGADVEFATVNGGALLDPVSWLVLVESTSGSAHPSSSATTEAR